MLNSSNGSISSTSCSDVSISSTSSVTPIADFQIDWTRAPRKLSELLKLGRRLQPSERKHLVQFIVQETINVGIENNSSYKEMIIFFPGLQTSYQVSTVCNCGQSSGKVPNDLWWRTGRRNSYQIPRNKKGQLCEKRSGSIRKKYSTARYCSTIFVCSVS